MLFQPTAFVFLMVASALAFANNKVLNCTQGNAQGVTQVLKATIADTADKAEVQKYATTAECASKGTCITYVYKKDMLPSVIRLTSATYVGGVTHSETIDIDRVTLAVTTKTVLKAPNGESETSFSGTCKLTVEESKKVL
jgi:hypothetical protein